MCGFTLAMTLRHHSIATFWQDIAGPVQQAHQLFCKVDFYISLAQVGLVFAHDMLYLDGEP